MTCPIHACSLKGELRSSWWAVTTPYDLFEILHAAAREKLMAEQSISFDHVHLISQNPRGTASWYVEKLAGRIAGQKEVGGVPQILVAFGGATLIIRGERAGEKTAEKTGQAWGIDHFGLRVDGDFDGFCDELKGRGVRFAKEPRDASPGVRIAFIEAPDDVRIELLHRSQ
jgi:catechol 2,3-dioxygenase-like lactoylglutathione lyase family enzyme